MNHNYMDAIRVCNSDDIRRHIQVLREGYNVEGSAKLKAKIEFCLGILAERERSKEPDICDLIEQESA